MMPDYLTPKTLAEAARAKLLNEVVDNMEKIKGGQSDAF